jgi:hypothetical protein
MAIDKQHKILNAPTLRFPEFGGNWTETTIGEQFDLYSGNTPSRLNKDSFKGIINWITSGELKDHYIYTTIEKISENAAKDNNLRVLPVGTFVIAIYGLEAQGVRGTGSITQQPSTISQACMAFIPKGQVTNEFVYSWYKKHGNTIGIRYAQGTKQQNLSYDLVSHFKISYPEQTNEQEKLVRFIRIIDDRISTQIRIIEDLKQLKNGIAERLYCNTPNYRIGDVITQLSRRNRSLVGCPVLSVSNRYGFIEQSEQFEDRIVASEDTSNYKVVEFDDFAYNPARINVGSIARLMNYERGIVSPMYICFHTKDSVRPSYLEYFFTTRYFFNEIEKRLEGSVRLCLSYEGLCNIPIYIPIIEEQERISRRMSALCQKINFEENYLRSLRKQKQYLLSQMFI